MRKMMTSPLDSVRASVTARDDAIRAAHDAGESAVAIAEAAGLSRQRVYQIIGPKTDRREMVERRLAELDSRWNALVDQVAAVERPPDSYVRFETAKRNGRRGKDARAGRPQRATVLAESRSFAEAKLLRVLRDNAEDATVALVLGDVAEANALRDELETLNDRLLGV